MVRVSAAIGRGVVATAPLPRGTIVWLQDRFDRVVPRDEGLGLDAAHRAVLDQWAHLDGNADWVLCWDGGRLVNHACDPSIRGLGPSIMVARRDLQAGDEITCDYAECNIEHALACDCGSVRCRRTVHGRDMLVYGPAWDDEARALLAAAQTTPQPLLPFAVDRQQAESMLAERTPIPTFVSQSAFRPGGPLA